MHRRFQVQRRKPSAQRRVDCRTSGSIWRGRERNKPSDKRELEHMLSGRLSGRQVDDDEERFESGQRFVNLSFSSRREEKPTPFPSPLRLLVSLEISSFPQKQRARCSDETGDAGNSVVVLHTLHGCVTFKCQARRSQAGHLPRPS